jgi:hypothetical protein
VPTGEDGVFRADVDRAGGFGVSVTDGGRELFGATYGPARPRTELPLVAALPPVHGGVLPPADELRADAERAAAAAELPVDRTPARLLWSGTVGGDRYRVVGLTAPTGARVLAVVRRSASDVVVVSGAALPTGELERAAVAWPVPGGTADPPVASGRVGVLGPVGATTAVVLADGREVGRAPLTSGFAVVTAPSATSVRYLDAGNRTVAEAPVGPLLDVDDSLPAALSR